MAFDTKDIPQYVPLHLHTEYSLLDGASKIKDLVQNAKANNMPALSITDHGVMYGALELFKEANNEGIKPIIGCETYVVNADYHDKSQRNPLYHLILLAKNDEGYINLSKIVSESILKGFYYKPRINKEFLKNHSKGLIALTACLGGEVPNMILQNKYNEARETAEFYKSIFREDFYLEIQDHGIQEEHYVTPLMAKLAQDLGVKLVATNDSHFTSKSDAIAQDALLCLQTNKLVIDYPRMHFTGTEYLKNGLEMLRLFSNQISENFIKQAVLMTPMEITEKIESYKILSDTSIKLPNFPIPSGMAKEEYLSDLVWKGIKERYNNVTPEVRSRTEHELKVINSQGFANYFLIVWDFIKYARDHKIAVGPGRGSAAGSIVAYALYITDIDPLKYNLLFERFLNPERESLPDIDTDFCIKRRDEVLKYVRDKYGNDKVAQIITFNKLASRAVIKDIARVLNYPYAESEKIAKMVPVVRGKPRELSWMKENHIEFNDQYKRNEDFKQIINLAEKLEGINKTFGVHAAGVIIADRPLPEIVPLSKNNDDAIITQFSMDDLAHLGLLKMDFLGLRNLTMMDKAINIIKETKNENIDLTTIPLDNENAFKMISKGDLAGIFQLETSSGMRQIAREMKPSTVEDLFALIALYRPGPLDTGMIDEFIARKNGKKKIEYVLPELKPILQDTYGSIVYQEQIMQIAQQLAGFSLGEADLLRKAMGKKKPQEMAKYRLKFINGCKENNFDTKVAEELFNMMLSFAEYCFNKSHSAAYGMLTYQTAYLKANYPLEYMTALLSSVLDDQDKIKYYMAECKNLNIAIMPPDINLSGVNFTADMQTGSIRFGLAAIKNVGVQAVNEIIRARSNEGIFKLLFDFCSRVDLKTVNKKTLESLIKSGAFDSTKQTRKEMISSLEEIVHKAQKQKDILLSGQLNLFGEDAAPEIMISSLEINDKREEFPLKEILLMEKELTGFYISSHPMDNIPDHIRKISTCNLSELQDMPDNSEALIIAVMTELNKKLTRNNKLIGIIKMEDILGKAEGVLFSSELAEYNDKLKEESIYLIYGRVQHRSEGETSVQIKAIKPLEELQILTIEIPEDATDKSNIYPFLHTIRNILQNGKSSLFNPAIIKVNKNADKPSYYLLNQKLWVEPNEKLTENLSKIHPSIKATYSNPFEAKVPIAK